MCVSQKKEATFEDVYSFVRSFGRPLLILVSLILRPKDLMNNKEMPLSRRAQDARVGYVAILVCNVLTT